MIQITFLLFSQPGTRVCVQDPRFREKVLCPRRLLGLRKGNVAKCSGGEQVRKSQRMGSAPIVGRSALYQIC